MATKGKPHCCNCKPCESEVNPCFVMTLGPIYVRHATGPEPTLELDETVIEYDPEDLPRGGEMLCAWNETTGKYECRAWVLTDMESAEETFTIADRYDGDTRFRSVPRPEVTGRNNFYGNICGGARDYGAWALPDAFDYSDGTFSYTHECENPVTSADCGGAPMGPDYCNFGITSSAGEPHCTSHLGSLRLRWYREGTGSGSGGGQLPPAYVEGVNAPTGNLVIWLDGGVTALGSWWAIVPWVVTPGSPPTYWWPIATPITLQWTPGPAGTTVDAPGATISDGGINEHLFQPMPDITLTSECDPQTPPPPPPDCEVVEDCRPCPCLLSPDGSTTYDVEAEVTTRDGDAFAVSNVTLAWNGTNWQWLGVGDNSVTLTCSGGLFMLVVVVNGVVHTFPVDIECDGTNIVDVEAGTVTPPGTVRVRLTTDNP